MKAYEFRSVLRLSVLSITLITLAACSAARVKPQVPEQNSPMETPTPEAPSVLKRDVKDIDFKSRNDDQSLKKRIAVLPFLDSAKDRSEHALTQARDAFMDDLNKSKEVIAIDSAQIKTDVSKFIKVGEYDLNKLSSELSKSGVSAVLEGKVIALRVKKDSSVPGTEQGLKAKFEAVVRIRLVNVRSGSELFHTVKTVTVDDGNTRIDERVSPEMFLSKNPELVSILIKDAFLEFTPQIVESMNTVTWGGRIAAFEGERIFLNVGRISGVQIGDILKVVEDGNEVYDPEIGYHIGKVAGRTKGTLEVIGYFGQDGAVSVIHSGAGFKENDRVELFQ